MTAQGLLRPIQPKCQPEQKETLFHQSRVAGRGRGSSTYTDTQLQEVLLLFETLEDCEVEHLVHGPRIWVVLWFQRARVDYHPKRCSCPKSFYSSTTDRGILRHPWCFPELSSVSHICRQLSANFHFLEDLQSVSEQCLTHLSKFRTTEARQLAKDSLGFFLLQLEIL